ncbi:related to recombinational repair protein mus-23 [Rhynchosporium secalis]|uniref:Double-strand break repair protein n=1 Tax=Rhynchosporium secalis TaxID=38038 RepID=A0A1E1M9V9_RHYSE|nr:related to recombinational repair protein mus-23 [Rhynchosporium secalis]
MPSSSADTIRILIATDSHVGYEERDPIRKDDSWKSFDEVMRMAKDQDVDMVLLAGDLFHDNKPSRKSIYQVMRSLRQNCLGDKPCELQFLSDANEVFDGAFNIVNYEDPDINVAIPVFSIHGNHDDPTGDGHLCSLDLLQVSGLLNYFGRTPESDRIDIKPVLLQKGSTKLALYGMSNVRDERLNRTFRDGGVKFFSPSEQKKEWFNLMAVHQNHYAHTESGYLPEHFLPDLLDLVVWGHEHECLIDPRENPTMGFHVMQPGSSVATSLVPGEAVSKHVAILSVTGRDFTVEKHRIKSVRPFVHRELVLAEDDRFKRLAKMKDNRSSLTVQLVKVVNGLIEEAKEEWLAIQDPDDPPEEVPLPLVRLRVEYSAPDGGKFDCENPQRFSNRFIETVANRKDVVQFYKKKTSSRKTNLDEKEMPDAEILAAISNDNVKVSMLVHEFLAAQSLKILPQEPFGDAVTQFVEKDDKHAVDTFIIDSLATGVRDLMGLDDEEDDLDTAMERLREKQNSEFKAGVKRPKRKGTMKATPPNWDSDTNGAWADQPGSMLFIEDADDDEDETPKPKRGAKKAAALSEDDNESVMSTTTKKAPAKKASIKKATVKPKAAPKAKAPAKTPAKGRKKVLEPSEDEDDDVIMLDDDEPAPTKSQPKRAAAITSRGRQTQINFSQSQAKNKAVRELSDDEISDDDDAFEPVVSSSRRK